MGYQLSKYFEGAPSPQGLQLILYWKDHGSSSCAFLTKWTKFTKGD